jgi:dihydroorotate dehydrogenase
MVLGLNTLYRRVLRPVLFRLDAEFAQQAVLATLQFATSVAPMSVLSPEDDPPELATSVWGVRFSNPIGLGAGVDKNARAALAWQAVGLGFAELGTITPDPQFGNPRPRIWRLHEEQALINSLGFPSKGCEWVLRRVRHYKKGGIQIRLALNFGPNKNTPPEKVLRDYASLMAKLGEYADFVVVNLSSPNTPGLREWQAPERMVSIVKTLRSTAIDLPRCPPILIKLAPDIQLPMLRDICGASVEHKVDGIIATNTTLKRDELGIRCVLPGGLSGQPLRNLARETIRRVYEYTDHLIPIVGVGGIASAEDAYGHIRAGATLVEFCTGMIYHGPGLVQEIKSGLVRLLNRDGFRSISEAVGTENSQAPLQSHHEVARVA